MTRLSLVCSALLATTALAFVNGCRPSHASEAAPGSHPPPGEVWLSADQVKKGKIEVGQVADQNVDDTLLLAGKVTFDDSHVAHVFSPVNGRVVRIDAMLGQHVKKGSPLAVIESPDIGIASSDVKKADADMIAAKHDYERQQELYKSKAAAKKDVETSEDNYNRAKAEYDRALQKARLLRAGNVEVSQGFVLTTPVDGEVIMKAVSPSMEVQGQYTGGNPAELFTVGKLDKVWVMADVFETDIARVKVGAKAQVKVVAYANERFEGTVDWVSGVLDPTTRTAKVRCTFDNPKLLLKPEMYATVKIAVEERRVLALAKSSVLKLGDQNIVFVQQGNTPEGAARFERVPVTVDEVEGAAWIPVTHGIEKGATVVTSGASHLATML